MLKEEYGKAAMKKMQVYKWHICFCDGHTTAGLFCMTTPEH
jgi:hypothetical protein